MASKWQQWMPFHIDRFRGSPDVQAMHPAARSGYIYLLASAWQTDDCTVPNDDLSLAALSGLGDEYWAIYKIRIMRKFDPVSDGKLRNGVLYEEWLEAKRVFEARRRAAITTTKVRSPRHPNTVTVDNHDGDRAVTDVIASRSADTITLTDTLTSTEDKELVKPSVPSPTAQEPKKPKPVKPEKSKVEATKTALAQSRHAAFKEVIRKYWATKNPDTPMPWGPQEGKQLEMWLRASPNTTVEQFLSWLRHRFNSEVNHGERPSVWIRNVTKFANGPIDKFGQLLSQRQNGGGNGHAAVPVGKGRQALAVLEEVIARRQRERSLNENGDVSPDSSGPGSAGTIHAISCGLGLESVPSGNAEPVTAGAPGGGDGLSFPWDNPRGNG